MSIQAAGRIENFYFTREALLPVARQLRPAFESAEPFRHVVIDDFLPADVVRAILESYPKPADSDWERFAAARESKLAQADEEAVPAPLRHVLQQFNSAPFVDFLEELTGIEPLIPDPHLVGGGLHQIVRGGYLKVHADFNKHQRLGLDRRLNALLYLNPDWQDEYGGHLELWDKGMTRPVRKVLPICNRFVVFATTSDSFHGHPDPLTCPEGVTRRSMAWYYYTTDRPDTEKRGRHSTLFRARPGEDIQPSAVERLGELSKRLVAPVKRALPSSGRRGR